MALLTNDFNQYPLIPFTIKFKIKDLFPLAKIQLAGGDGHHPFGR